jgi:hypothetical protein
MGAQIRRARNPGTAAQLAPDHGERGTRTPEHSPGEPATNLQLNRIPSLKNYLTWVGATGFEPATPRL